MSKLAKKKEKLLKNGREQRGTWTPSAGSWYSKLYVDYHTRKRLPLNRQGRCEYFHRVIWQILFVLRTPALIGLLIALLAAFTWVCITHPMNVLTLIGTCLLLIYGVAGVLIAMDSRVVIFKARDTHLIPWIKSSPKVAIPVLGLLFLPGFAAMWVLIGLFYGIVFVLESLSKVSWIERAGTWFANGSLIPLRGFRWIRPWAVVALAAWVVLNILVPEFIKLSIVVGFVLGIATVVVGFALLAETFKSKQQRRKVSVVDDDQDIVAYVSLSKPKRPSWFARAWRNTVEFFAFLGAFIRTMKWKVCPVAEVSDGKDTDW